LGTTLEELSKNWKAETVYTPRMKDEERSKRLSQWNKALEAVKMYHRM
jgi:glycerol kinase